MVFCQKCGSKNTDPGGPLKGWNCGVCHQAALVRIPDTGPPSLPPRARPRANDAVAGGTIGGTIGGMFGGPVGAVLGVAVGVVVAAAIFDSAKKTNFGKSVRKRVSR